MILTSDAATILRELEVVHPAAKLLVMASQQQDAEMGDGTNLVIVLAGELLKKAEELLRLGLKTSDISQGYEKAQNFALKVLEGGLLIFQGCRSRTPRNPSRHASGRPWLTGDCNIRSCRGPFTGHALPRRTRQGPPHGSRQ